MTVLGSHRNSATACSTASTASTARAPAARAALAWGSRSRARSSRRTAGASSPGSRRRAARGWRSCCPASARPAAPRLAAGQPRQALPRRVGARRLKDMWSNWAGDQRCSPVALERPASTGEVVAALERATTAGERVRVAGSGHSFTDAACTDGRLLSLERMDRVLDVDRASGLVRVEGGITINALSATLAQHGLAFENLGDIDVQSIAGAISTATHGTGARLRNLSAQVESVELVLADGSTLVCSASDDDPTAYLAARVGVGSLGVIAAVTLRAVPAFTLRGVDKPAPLGETLDRLEQLGEASDHFELYAFPHCDTALTRTNTRVEEPPRPRSQARAYAQDVLLTNRAFHAFCLAGRALPRFIPAFNRTVVRLAGTSVRVDRSDRIFASPRLVRFTEMEYALPRERTAEAVRRVLALVEQRGFHVPFPIEVRTVAPDDALLSP